MRYYVDHAFSVLANAWGPCILNRCQTVQCVFSPLLSGLWRWWQWHPARRRSFPQGFQRVRRGSITHAVRPAHPSSRPRLRLRAPEASYPRIHASTPSSARPTTDERLSGCSAAFTFIASAHPRVRATRPHFGVARPGVSAVGSTARDTRCDGPRERVSGSSLPPARG